MKLKFILLLLLAIPLFSFAQNDYATIHIYTPNQLFLNTNKYNITINNNFICSLSKKEHLEFKIFTSNEVIINIEGIALGIEKLLF